MSSVNLPTKSDIPAILQHQTVLSKRNGCLKVSDSVANPALLTGSDENSISSQEVEIEKHNSRLEAGKENETIKEFTKEVDRESLCSRNLDDSRSTRWIGGNQSDSVEATREQILNDQVMRRMQNDRVVSNNARVDNYYLMGLDLNVHYTRHAIHHDLGIIDEVYGNGEILEEYQSTLDFPYETGLYIFGSSLFL